MNNRLYILINMMMYMLTSDSSLSTSGFLAVDLGLGVLVLRPLIREATLHLVCIIVLILTFFDWNLTMMMLLWQSLGVRYWLLCCVVVVLVDFTVNGWKYSFMFLLRDGLVVYGWCRSLVDCGIVLAVLGPNAVSRDLRPMEMV